MTQMKKIAKQNPRDREWIGRILFMRRRIRNLCRTGELISVASVTTIIDEVLPNTILKQEKVKEDEHKRRYKRNRGRTDKNK